MAIGLAAAYLRGSGGGSAAPVAPSENPPADDRPALHISPVRVTARNGPIDTFGLITNGVREQRGRRLGFVVACHGKCTQVSGADWSADGSVLVYSTACAGGCASKGIPEHGVHVLNVRTNVDRIVVHTDSFGEVGVSADGSEVAYSDHDRLTVVPTDGSAAPRTIVGDARWIGKPTWSPAADWIVYPDDGYIYLIRADGSDRRLLTAGSVPAWSPDGQWIAYVHQHRLRLISPDGQRHRTVPRPGPCWACTGGVDSPDWSPDGRKIAYAVHGRTLIVTVASGAAHRPRGFVRPNASAFVTWRPA